MVTIVGAMVAAIGSSINAAISVTEGTDPLGAAQAANIPIDALRPKNET